LAKHGVREKGNSLKVQIQGKFDIYLDADN